MTEVTISHGRLLASRPKAPVVLAYATRAGALARARPTARDR